MERKMKKLISLILVSLTLSLAVFAGSWKPYDFIKQNKLEKIIKTYNLQETETGNSVNTLYKSEDNKNWIFIFKQGNTSFNDKQVYEIVFIYLDGVFDSCTKYSSAIRGGTSETYLTAVVIEKDYSVSKSDYSTGSSWVWTDPQQCFLHLFWKRMQVFNILVSLQDKCNFEVPEDAKERYSYMSNWYNTHYNDNNLKAGLASEYKKYLKEHKTN